MHALIPAPCRRWMRTVLYRTVPASTLRNVKRAIGAPQVHQRAAYWNEELAGRMSNPNVNGRVGNALRHATTAQLISHCGPTPAAVLDVGCGLCELASVLAGHGLQRYVGVDLSDFAIARAQREHASWPVATACDLSFHRADLRDFDGAEGPFDVIVFNEVLKYVELDEAVHQTRRYSRWLAPHGVICVALAADPKSDAVLRALDGHLTWVYGVIYQQCPSGPRLRLARSDRATPPFTVGLFRPAGGAS